MKDRRALQILRKGHCDIEGAGHVVGATVRLDEGRLISACPACAQRIDAHQLLRILQRFLMTQIQDAPKHQVGPGSERPPPDEAQIYVPRPLPDEREYDVDEADEEPKGDVTEPEDAWAWRWPVDEEELSPTDRWIAEQIRDTSESWWEEILEYKDSYDFLPY